MGFNSGFKGLSVYWNSNLESSAKGVCHYARKIMSFSEIWTSGIFVACF